jgi:hypothetical protein
MPKQFECKFLAHEELNQADERAEMNLQGLTGAASPTQ